MEKVSNAAKLCGFEKVCCNSIVSRISMSIRRSIVSKAAVISMPVIFISTLTTLKKNFIMFIYWSSFYEFNGCYEYEYEWQTEAQSIVINKKCQIANQRYCSIKFFIYTRLWLDRLPFYFLEKIYSCIFSVMFQNILLDFTIPLIQLINLHILAIRSNMYFTPWCARPGSRITMCKVCNVQ